MKIKAFVSVCLLWIVQLSAFAAELQWLLPDRLIHADYRLKWLMETQTA